MLNVSAARAEHPKKSHKIAEKEEKVKVKATRTLALSHVPENQAPFCPASPCERLAWAGLAGWLRATFLTFGSDATVRKICSRRKAQFWVDSRRFTSPGWHAREEIDTK